MNTVATLSNMFSDRTRLSWKTHKIVEVDISYVLWYMLKKHFVVEIDGYKYEVSFALNSDNEIGSCISMEDSPSMTSYNVLNYGFQDGKWFEILDEELSKDEKEAIDDSIREKQEKDFMAFITKKEEQERDFMV